MTERVYDYLIVGAGPGGIQLGYFFEKAGHDYLILERANEAGSFFRKFPRHRKLISINKKYLGQLEERENVDCAEVALRYDWNSLLCDDPEFRFTKYTDDYFPDADLYVDYLNDFVKKYRVKIDYGVEVRKISKINDIFQLVCGNNKVYRCKRLIMATGLSKPNIPDNIPGIELAIGYEEMGMDKEKYRNKHVMVMGTGNSAFEVADWLTPIAGYVAMFGRSPLKMAWKTHYVGDLRAVNNNYLDTFQLKSNNILDFWDDFSIKKLKNGKFVCREEPFEYDYVIRCLGFRFDGRLFDDPIELDQNGKIPKIKVNYESTSVDNLYFVGTSAQALDYHKSSSAFMHGFRYTSQFLSNYFLYGNDLNAQLPTETIKLTSKENLFIDLSERLIDLVNESSSIFQLFKHYCHVLIFSDEVKLIKFPIPIDFIKNLKEMIGDSSFMVVSMVYGFDDDEDVFQPFPLYDVFNGIQSRFLHPLISYYQSYDHFQNNEFVEYDQCVCGRWETAEFLKKETICKYCIKCAYCTCGNNESLNWFLKNINCKRCQEGNPYTKDDLYHKFYSDIKKPVNGYLSHHIAEDVNVAFKRGFCKSMDISYRLSLIRYLECIFLDRRIPLIGQYLNRIEYIVKSNNSLDKRPFQLRFWTFNSHIFVKCPLGEELVNKDESRQTYLYENNRRIRDNSKEVIKSLYKGI